MKLAIEPKKKPCKGTTPETKGWGCGKPTYHRHYGLGKMCCYPTWLLESEPGKIKLEKAKLKASKPFKDLEQAHKEKKERKGLTTLLKSVKDVCHSYIRKRDKGKPCISCDTQWHSDFEAGHYYPAGKYSTLRFNEDNIHGQCIRCNRGEEGNLSEYNVGIAHRIGQDRAYELHRLADLEKKTDFKWDREELKRIRTYYREKLKEL